MTNDMPREIWMQVNETPDGHTWCSDQVHDDDTKYHHDDVVQEMTKTVEELHLMNLAMNKRIAELEAALNSIAKQALEQEGGE